MPDSSNSSDRPVPDHNLRDISHLFLSSIRDHASEGRPRPQRTPPQSSASSKHPAESIDLTPEEFAQVFGGSQPDENSDGGAQQGSAPVPPVVAIIGAHLNGKQFDRAKEYARHLAGQGMRIGLIELDASEFRVMCFDRYSGEPDASAQPDTSFDPRRMTEVLEEMSWDVQRWLLVLPQCRVPEARGLLRECAHWAMLSTCDHDGVISCYRTLKGLTDLWPASACVQKPRLSLALLDAPDEEESERISSKLVSVCQQFLSWEVEAESPVRESRQISEHLVMCARPTRDKSQFASPPQWEIVMDFIRRSKQSASVGQETAGDELPDGLAPEVSKNFEPVMREIPAAQPGLRRSLESVAQASPAQNSIRHESSEEADVIDLLESEPGEMGIVNAVLRHCSSELVECPIAPPMCPKARLAVSRDRRIVMLAVSREGLQDLSSIGQAYRWLQENQNLIGMAVPQLSIDPQQPPHLSLLVNQSDSAAHTLQPMLQGDHVTVKTYRKLRWGGKTGLLLEAA
jgi:hypothetical protein